MFEHTLGLVGNGPVWREQGALTFISPRRERSDCDESHCGNSVFGAVL